MKEIFLWVKFIYCLQDFYKRFFPSQKIDFIRIDASVYDNINSRILMKDVHVVVYDRLSRLNTKRFLQTQRIGSVLLGFPTIIPNTVRKLLKVCNVTFSPEFPFNPISPWGPVGPWELQINQVRVETKRSFLNKGRGPGVLQGSIFYMWS